MILATRRGGNVELRFGTQHMIPAPWSGTVSNAGVVVNTRTATGVPAVGRAIRLIAGLAGLAHIAVYQGRKGDKREQPRSTPAMLLEDPYPGVSVYDWRYDIAASLEASENAFVRKIKTSRGKLVALQPLPPSWVNAYLDRDGEKVFEISTPQGWKRARPGEILHIRGQTVDGGPFGVSRIHQHRDPLGAILAAQTFEGSYFRNHARPDVAFVFPETVGVEKGRQYEAEIVAKYGGPDNFGKPYVVGGGADIRTIPINLRDAQFVESKNLSVEEVARIMDVEPLLIGGGQGEQQDTQAMDRFLAFQLPPRLARIAAGLKADPDLFPAGSPLYPEFDVDPLTFASPATRAAVQHQQVQTGTLLRDEARADNGRPPLPDGLGQIPVVTPVGAAPNPNPLPNGSEGEPAEPEE